jgi:hypothetical protein
MHTTAWHEQLLADAGHGVAVDPLTASAKLVIRYLLEAGDTLLRSPGPRSVLEQIVPGDSVGSATVGRRTEEPIHDRHATLNDRTNLMPVDEFGDAGAAVTHEPGHVFDRHARV